MPNVALIRGFTYTLALEGKKRNINANVIAPLAASRMMETVTPAPITSHRAGWLHSHVGGIECRHHQVSEVAELASPSPQLLQCNIVVDLTRVAR